MNDNLPTYGGQAVIEGVMMRGKYAMAIAMRAPNRDIKVYAEKLSQIYTSRLIKIPFLRGVIGLWDALVLGMRALTISANTQTGEDEKLEGPSLYITLGVSLIVAVALFSFLPAGIGQLSENLIEAGLAVSNSSSAWIAWFSNFVEGCVRLFLLIGYLWLIGKMPEIQRVFAYHGAEHKTINAFEAGVELTPEIVDQYSLEHPRCGTAFLLTLVLISILLFSLLGPLPLFWRLTSRVLLLPILAGLAYEYIRWTAKHVNSPIVRLLIKPNLALQRMTTRQPSIEILEVGIKAFQAMRRAENELIP